MTAEKYNLESLAQRLDTVINTSGVAMAFGRDSKYEFISNTDDDGSRITVDALAAVKSIQESPAKLYGLERNLRRYEHTYQDIKKRVEAGRLEGKLVEGVYVPEGKRMKNFNGSNILELVAMSFAMIGYGIYFPFEKMSEKSKNPFVHKVKSIVENVASPFVGLGYVVGYAVALPAAVIMNSIVNPLRAGSSIRAYEKLENRRQKIVKMVPEDIFYKSLHERLNNSKRREAEESLD